MDNANRLFYIEELEDIYANIEAKKRQKEWVKILTPTFNLLTHGNLEPIAKILQK